MYVKVGNGFTILQKVFYGETPSGGLGAPNLS